jgi:hypothetical protein
MPYIGKMFHASNSSSKESLDTVTSEGRKLTADGKSSLAVSLPSLLVGVVGVGIALMTFVITKRRRDGEGREGVNINVQVNIAMTTL